MTTTLTTTVYLNAGAAYSSGFDAATACLYEAARFDLAVGLHAPGPAAVTAALEEIFCQLNIDTPTAAWALQYRLAGHRSLSVGDVVTLGETAWACAPLGWTPLTAPTTCASHCPPDHPHDSETEKLHESLHRPPREHLRPATPSSAPAFSAAA